MKLIIAGSRGIQVIDILEEAIKLSGFIPEVTEVVSGMADGVDTLGEVWADDNNIPVAHFPANWRLYGRAAGYVRNKEMAEYADSDDDALLAVWDGESRGTMHMINLARAAGLRTFIYNLQELP